MVYFPETFIIFRLVITFYVCSVLLFYDDKTLILFHVQNQQLAPSSTHRHYGAVQMADEIPTEIMLLEIMINYSCHKYARKNARKIIAICSRFKKPPRGQSN